VLDSRGRGWGALAAFGPAFVASVAYVDPGNFGTDFTGGAQFGYQFVWIVVLASAAAILAQYLASKLGLVTGASLPEICRQRFGRRLNTVLWLQAEAICMATDIAEFTGAALGLNLIFRIPLFLAGLLTALITFLVLALQQLGHRPFEVAITALVGLVAAGLGYVLVSAGKQDPAGIASGLIPTVGSGSGLELAVGIIGATIMPHVIYAHSDLQTNRLPALTRHDRKILLRFSRWDCIAALSLAGLVNLVMLCTAAAVLRPAGGAVLSQLPDIHARLASVVGGGCAFAFAFALLVCGVASSCVGTYAGQVVMAGFMNWRSSLYVRRVVSVLPSLIVLGVTSDTTRVLIFSQVVLSFGLPFALIPLFLLTGSRQVMGDMVNARLTTTVMAVVTILITVLDCYLVWSALAP
jgi:manganese transport protein